MTDRLRWSSIPALVRDSAVRFGDLEVIAEGDRRLTFAELADAMTRSARATIAAGLGPGDRAAIWAPNSWEWICVALGVLAAGGVVVPVNTRFKGEEARFVLEKSGARVLFTVNGFLGVDYAAVLEAAGRPATLATIVTLRGEPSSGAMAWAEFLAAGEATDPESVTEREAALTPGDLSDLMFTSGTTGRPKGVMTTHGQSLQVFVEYNAHLGIRTGDRYLVVNPFFHTFGYKAGVISAIISGGTVVPVAVFDVPAVLALIEAERITVLPGPPTVLSSILDHPDRDRFDLSSLRLTVTGAATVPVELIRRLRAETTFETILTAYGLTETSAVVSVCNHDDDIDIVANWSGHPIPHVEVKIVDLAGQELPRGQPGEVWVRGYNVTRGYWDEPEQTAAAIDPDGWLHTGDVGVMNDHDYLRITDRIKDMFIVGGFNAYPAEIENLLLGDDRIAQVAVVGAPDPRLGEVGMAFVVARPGATIEPEEVIAFAREVMANFKVPRYVEIVDGLPTTASGKVLKRDLRSRAAELVASRP
jgi:acyl-CoA synthetase (AMP-forming)/AMP-acid ligase II